MYCMVTEQCGFKWDLQEVQEADPFLPACVLFSLTFRLLVIYCFAL